MKISYNPKSSQNVIDAQSAANDDIIFDLKSSKLWAKGVRIGADWDDISNKPTSLKNPASIRFKDINGNVITYDGSVAKDLTSGVNVAKLPYGFNSFASEVSWGNTTGTSFASWNDSTGGSIDFRRDNPSSGKMSIKVDGRVYVNEGANPVLSAESNNGFWGMRTPDGGNDWIRTPNNGLIPYVSGKAGKGNSSLGTNTWYFSTAYIDNVFGNLKGNADTATTAVKADNATNADKLDGHHETYFMRTLDMGSDDWNDNITAGCYKVQNPSKNKPGNYNFGMGLTLATENHNDGENRICQIYFSHGHDYAMAVRTHNSAKGFDSGWDSWALVPTTTGNIASATKLQTARSLWGNSFDGTKDINGSIVFPAIDNTAISNKISWSSSSDGADIYYQTTAQDQGNLVLNVADDNNAYIQLALNGVFKSHFDVANSYWTGRSAQADKWTNARTFTIGNSAKSVDGSGNVSWSLAEMGVASSGHTHAWNSLTHNSTVANQAILTTGTTNGWKLETLNIANWNTAYNFVNNITKADTDKIINKWDEIVNFLAGIDSSNKLNTLLNSKLSIQELDSGDILTTKTNNALFWASTIGTANHIPTGPFTKHPYALLSVTNFSENTTNDKYFYRSRLAFSSVGDIKVASCHHQGEYKQDETWYDVLTSKNSGIDGSTIKLNNSSITVYSSATADNRYVKKSGDIMTGILNIKTSGFGTLHITMNDDVNAAAIQFGGKSSVYGYIGFNINSKDKQLLRWASNSSKPYIILDTSSTYTSDGKGVINGTTITQVDNATSATSATSATNATNASKLVNWYSERPTSLNEQFGDGSLKIFYATSTTTEGKSPEDAVILHLAWDNNNGWDSQLAIGHKVYTRTQDQGTWGPWRTLAFTTDIPTSLKNPNALILKANGTILATYDGSSAKEANFTYANVGAASATHTHTWTSIMNKIVFDNEFDIVNAGYNDEFWFNYLPIDDRSKTAQVRKYIMGNGAMGYASVHASEFVKHGSNNSYVLLGGGDHATISSLSVKHATSADSATKVIVNQHRDNDIDYPLVWSNQNNDNTATGNQLFKSWQDLYYNPKNKKLTVAGSISTSYVNATNTVSSAGFVHSAVTEDANEYVLTADGGYTRLNQTINEGEYSFDKDITVTDQWTDIDGFYGGSDSFLNTNGTYVVQVYYKIAPANGMYDGYLSGIMSWYTKNTNSNNADEIVLHRAGHAYANTIYLRTAESPTPGYTKLQISANKKLSKNTYTFKFKRIC